MLRIRKYLKPFIIPIGISLILLFVKALADLNLPAYMAEIVDTGLKNSGVPNATPEILAKMEAEGVNLLEIQQGFILKIGLKMLGMTLLGITASIGVGLLGARVGAGLGRDLRQDIFKKVQSFSTMEFNKFGAASLITRTTNDVTQIQALTIVGIQVAFAAPLLGIGGVVMVILHSPSMAWILAVACACILILMIGGLIAALPKFQIVQKLTDDLTKVSRENLTGLMVTRAFRTEEYEAQRFDKSNDILAKTNQSIYRIMVVLFPSLTLLMNLTNVLIIWVGANEIVSSGAQVGQIMAFIQYATMVIFAFIMISAIFVILPRASVSANRIADVLEEKSSIESPENPQNFVKEKLGWVEFKDVTFGYDGADEKVIDRVSFTAKPGETTAIIGSTGSGKSTMINLIPRFYDVTSGSVLVNGVDVRQLDLQELYSQIGYIPQKGSLLSGTIETNLKYGNRNADDEFVEKCARVAQAEEFILGKESGYQSRVAQGGHNISGGQKQRISIARALVTAAPILIFDDSFSALDMKTDANLREALSHHAKDTNVIIVAQRVSTILNADQIIVLDEGKMVGMGTHKQLLQNCHQYHEIAASQLSKEEIENA